MTVFDVRSKCTGTGLKDTPLNAICQDTFTTCQAFASDVSRDNCAKNSNVCVEGAKNGKSSFELEMYSGGRVGLTDAGSCFRTAVRLAKAYWPNDYRDVPLTLSASYVNDIVCKDMIRYGMAVRKNCEGLAGICMSKDIGGHLLPLGSQSVVVSDRMSCMRTARRITFEKFGIRGAEMELSAPLLGGSNGPQTPKKTIVQKRSFLPVDGKTLLKNAIKILQGGGKDTVQYRSALNALDEASHASPASVIGRYAFLLRDAMGQGDTMPEARTIYKNKDILIQKFDKVDGFSIIFFKERPLEPVIIPGAVKIKWVRSQMQVHVPNYFGKFSVVFKDPERTIPANSSALLVAYHMLPNEFFEGFKSMIFTGVEQKGTSGEYASNVVTMYRSTDPIGTIVHELTHHWDEKIAIGTDGKDLGFGDPSKLFYNISWTPERIKREIPGRDHGKVPMDRHDFDKDAFAYDYGMCNRSEDIATMADFYVTRGRSIRSTIRQQMLKGKFELAAKYLFVRYIMPFRGREYELKNDSLGLEDVKKGMEAYKASWEKWSKDPKEKISANVMNAIKRIEDKYEEIKYK